MHQYLNMRLQLLSDVHAEFDEDSGDAFVASLDPSRADVLILAGDMGSHHHAMHVVGRLCAAYAPKPVVYVHGNHEYYKFDRPRMTAMSVQLEREHENLMYLDKELAFLHVGAEKRRLLGATLWYEDKFPTNWSDYRHISGFQSWHQEEAEATKTFFEEDLEYGDIVVTHMLPSKQCVHPKWVGNVNNCYFVHDLTTLIEERQPRLWLFGHTHEVVDVKIGETRLVSCPRAYPHERGDRPYEGVFIDA